MRPESADCPHRPSAVPAALPLLRVHHVQNNGGADTPSPTGAAPLPHSPEKYFANHIKTGSTCPAAVAAPRMQARYRPASQSPAATSSDIRRGLPATPVALCARRNLLGGPDRAAAEKFPSDIPACA